MTRITPEHLSRAAWVYVRQSTPSQVRHNHESRGRQYALKDRARQLGWSDVVLVDDDLGRSGGGTERPGYDRLLAAVCRGEVGAVLSLEASRLARNGREWLRGRGTNTTVDGGRTGNRTTSLTGHRTRRTGASSRNTGAHAGRSGTAYPRTDRSGRRLRLHGKRRRGRRRAGSGRPTSRRRCCRFRSNGAQTAQHPHPKQEAHRAGQGPEPVHEERPALQKASTANRDDRQPVQAAVR